MKLVTVLMTVMLGLGKVKAYQAAIGLAFDNPFKRHNKQ